MNRRHLIVAALGCLGMVSHAIALEEHRVRRIGYFSPSSAQSNAAWLAAFREGMAELHWVEGRDYVIDARYANGVAQAGPRVVADLVATQPDLVLSSGDQGPKLLLQRTRTLPIVFAISVDPVGAGLAASLQHPGGNLTGLTNLSSDLGAKRLQLLKEAFPRVAQVVLLFEPDNVAGPSQAKVIQEAATHLGMHVTPIGLRKAADIEPAFKRGAGLAIHAYVVIGSVFMNNYRKTIVEHAMRSKVPAIFPGDAYVEAGGLISYAPSFRDNFRRAAIYVDKIFKGAKPGDLPIEQPVKFELVVNLKSAKAMGLTIPQSILLRADRVIE